MKYLLNCFLFFLLGLALWSSLGYQATQVWRYLRAPKEIQSEGSLYDGWYDCIASPHLRINWPTLSVFYEEEIDPSTCKVQK